MLLALLAGGLLAVPWGAGGQAGAARVAEPRVPVSRAAESRAAEPRVAEYSDSRADEGRTVPAYLDPEDADRIVRVFSVTFWARQGERRYITSRVLARQATSTPDTLLMASVSVSCSPSKEGVSNAGATQNVLRGDRVVLTPRFVYVVPRTGMVGCVLVASGLRPRPSASGPSTANVWYVELGSYLEVSEPMGWWPRSLASRATSRVIARGQRWTPIASIVPVGADETSFELVSDHKVTTCSSVGGSRDSSTDGRELCAGRVSTRGSWVRLVVSAVQLGRQGRACAKPQVFRSLRKVTPEVHHAMVFSTSVVPVSRAASCGSRFAVRGSIEHAGGADVVIHAPSERTSVLRR